MKEYIFKYRKYKGRFHPIVPVALFAKAPIRLEAYVDSGASLSIFTQRKEVRFLMEGKLE